MDRRRLTSGASLGEVARDWTRLGVTGFGGPPAHVALLRALVVERRGWLDAEEFEDANAACGVLPGPASTQLAIYCAYRVGGWRGAVVGGLGFVVPAVVFILALSVLFLASAPPRWVMGAGAGAGAAVAAVAVHAGRSLLGPSYARARGGTPPNGGPPARGAAGDAPGAAARPAGAAGPALTVGTVRWALYVAAGAAAAILIGPLLVLVLLGCGAVELVRARWLTSGAGAQATPTLVVLLASASVGSVGALAWLAFKVGALSYGGGFVIIPLMQDDAVNVHHWMTNAQFLNAVALGQITPGPVVSTVAAVGYSAYGIPGGVLAAVVAFLPSFSFVLIAGRRFALLRRNRSARAFLDGAGPAAIGAIFGAAVTLAAALTEAWQVVLLAAAALALLVLGRGVVPTLLAAGGIGVLVALAGGPLP